MTNHAIDIYYFTMSPPSRAVLLLMKTLGIKPNVKIVNIFNGEQMKPEYTKLNPLHTIPTIVDNGFVLYDSNAIMKYLVDQYAKDDSLCPRDTKKGAIVSQRLFFVSSILFPRFVASHFGLIMGKTVDDDAKTKFKEALDYINNILSDSKWIAGDNMTIADYAVVAILSNVQGAGVYDLPSYPNLLQWFERTKSALSSYGYEEIMQAGADAFAHMFKSKVGN